MDANGTIDVSVETYAFGNFGTLLSAHNRNEVFGRDYPPPSNDFGFYTIPLFSGEEIGPSLPTPYGPLAGFYNDDILMGGGTLAANDGFGGHYWGEFLFIRGYAGIRFEINNQLHYAWLDLNNDFGTGVKVHGWAYETEPDTPIVAGAVPEPSALALAACGALAMTWRRQWNGTMP